MDFPYQCECAGHHGLMAHCRCIVRESEFSACDHVGLFVPLPELLKLQVGRRRAHQPAPPNSMPLGGARTIDRQPVHRAPESLAECQRCITRTRQHDARATGAECNDQFVHPHALAMNEWRRIKPSRGASIGVDEGAEQPLTDADSVNIVQSIQMGNAIAQVGG
jgi:hypothetical protein